MGSRSMDWNERVWIALKRAVTGMPVFVRGRALRKIVEGSEGNARARGSGVVEEEDLVRAVNEKVPRLIRPMCTEALREQGVKIE